MPEALGRGFKPTFFGKQGMIIVRIGKQQITMFAMHVGTKGSPLFAGTYLGIHPPLLEKLLCPLAIGVAKFPQSRQDLSDQELLDFLQYLRSQPSGSTDAP